MASVTYKIYMESQDYKKLMQILKKIKIQAKRNKMSLVAAYPMPNGWQTMIYSDGKPITYPKTKIGQKVLQAILAQ